MSEDRIRLEFQGAIGIIRSIDTEACQAATKIGPLGGPSVELRSTRTNWQRRTFTNTPTVAVRDHMGNGPFDS
jgi:hypothetical protein